MARNSMNVVDVYSWTGTTGRRLSGLRVDNVYYEEGRLLLKLRGEAPLILVIEPGRRAHVSWRSRPPSEYKPTPLLLLLRKHVRGSRVESVEQLGFDRVVKISFTRGYTLIAELLPRGVLALLDPSGMVLEASKRLKARDRVVKPKIAYTPPPLNTLKIEELAPEELVASISKGRDLVRGMVRGLGIPGEVAEEAIARSGVPGSLKPGDLGAGLAEKLIESLKDILSESLKGRGYLVFREGVPVEADPFTPTRFREEDVEVYETFDEALDNLFKGAPESPGEAGSEKERLLRSLEEAMRRAEEYAARSRELLRAAEALSANYARLELVAKCVREKLLAGLGSVEDCEGVSYVDPGRGVYRVSIGGLEVELGLGETIDKAILRLYREAGILRGKAERALKARSEAEGRLKELEMRVRIRELRRKARSRRVRWFERYHWTVTTSGYLVIAGRDSSQNESLVKRYLDDNDIFMHADIHGAPAVVVKCGGEEPGSEDLEEASVIAAAYSKAWKAGLGSVQVYWVWGGQVSKAPPPGEYLPKGAFMIYGKRNYLKPTRLELSLGVALDSEGAPLVVAGHERIVSRASLAYAVLAPGDMSLEVLAEAVRKRLASVLREEYRHIPQAIDLKEYALRIPGRGKILYAREGRGLGVETPLS